MKRAARTLWSALQGICWPVPHASPKCRLVSRIAGLFLVVCLALSSTGCNAILILGYLIGGPPAIEPDFERQTKKKLTEKGKKCLVLCYAPTELKWDNEDIDRQVARWVSLALNAKKISVIDPDRVQAWLDKNPDWDKAADVGAHFKVDYVIYIDLKQFSLYEEHSANLYRGRTDAILSVIEMDKRKGNSIYSKEITSRYPSRAPASSSDIPFDNFKKRYMAALSDEIGRHFYESFAGDDIPNGVLN